MIESMVYRMIWGDKKEKATVPIEAAQQRKNRKRRSSAAAAIIAGLLLPRSKFIYITALSFLIFWPPPVRPFKSKSRTGPEPIQTE
jgi:hypothetical protein